MHPKWLNPAVWGSLHLLADPPGQAQFARAPNVQMHELQNAISLRYRSIYFYIPFAYPRPISSAAAGTRLC
jgi:hypothetical protein